MKTRTSKLVLTRMVLANQKAKTSRNPLRTDPTRTTGMREHFCRFVDRQFDKLKADVLRAVGKEDWLGVGKPIENVVSPTTNLYRPFVCNGEVGYFPSRGLIEVPDVRQDEATSCGAAAAMSVGKYFGVGPGNLAQWKVALGTSYDGTHPEPIVEYLRSLGLQVEAFQHGNLGTLDEYLDRGWPVICCVQDYGPKHTWEHGHYLVVIGHSSPRSGLDPELLSLAAEFKQGTSP